VGKKTSQKEMRAPMTLDIFSFAFLFMCYYTDTYWQRGIRIGERQKNLQKRKLSARFGFQHDEKREDDYAQNIAHDIEIKARDDTT
jgi:hypothetical protein